jgi:transcriptional regulator with XRE-family HTH domain
MEPPIAAKDRLRALRKTRGWSQEHVGNHCEVSTSLVCEWEKGSRVPTLVNSLQLEDLFEGELRAEDFGHSTEEIASVRRAFYRRMAEHAATGTDR